MNLRRNWQIGWTMKAAFSFSAAALLSATFAGCVGAEDEDEEPVADELICTGPGCTCGPTFGIGFLQSTWGSGANKNFEAVFPRAGGGFSHYHRDNGYPNGSLPWYGPASFGSGDVGGVSLIQSNYGLGHLEVVATIGTDLWAYFRDDGGTWGWNSLGLVRSGVKGQPALIQGSSGTVGNFEVVVPTSGNGLYHLYRNNDAAGIPWTTTATIGTGFNYEAASLIQSSYGGGTHLEVIARTGTSMHAFYRDSGGTWNGPFALTNSAGQPIVAKGTFTFIQSTFGGGTHKNFELVAPLPAGGLAHYYRDNATHVWYGPTVIDPTGDYTAAAVIQGSYGNLDYVARKDGELVWGHNAGGFSPRYGWGAEPCCDPLQKGQWTDPIDTNIVGIHASLQRTGKVLFFGFTDDNDQIGQSSVFNPATNGMEVTGFSPLPHHPDMFCSGHAPLPDGRLWVAGGHHTDLEGSTVFDPATQTWAQYGSLDPAPGTRGRWYPTNATLPDGRVFTISGTLTGGPTNGVASSINNTWQTFNPATNTVSATTNVTPNPYSTIDGFAAVDLYPFVYVVPGGTRAGQLMIHSRQTTRFLQTATNSWSGEYVAVSPNSRTYPAEGTSVMLMLSAANGYAGRVLAIGGAGPNPSTSTPATSTVEMIDLGLASPAWQSKASMNEPRVLPDSVLLPNGHVFVVGGSRSGKADNGTDPVLTPETYDPSANTWTKMCPMRVPRLYHSTALLLPDARVLVAGRDGKFNAGPYNWPEHRVEIYSPPYLFAGPRPTLGAVPSNIVSGQSFQVSWSGTTGMVVSKAVLMRLGAVTHSFNMNQRGVELAITGQTSSTVTLTAPPNANVAPPGHYMLFLLSSQGVPSVAKVLRFN